MDVGDVAIAILAAGKASRFGADKLMAQMDGVPLGLLTAHRLAQMRCAGASTSVVSLSLIRVKLRLTEMSVAGKRSSALPRKVM